MKIAFIGGGNMGEAIFSAILKNIDPPPAITVSEIDATRRLYIMQKSWQDKKGHKFSITVVDVNLSAIQDADIIVLAIKPQTLPSVMTELNGKLKPEQLVLSIIAGARIDKIRNGLNHQRIIRSMPNTPAQIGEGMTVWTATPEVTSTQKEWAKAILGAMGEEIQVTDEKFLDMATAVSGSGPAYVFYFTESLIEAAVKIGWPRDTAVKLVMQTLAGATHLMQKSDKTPTELCRAVTSPGGTTAAAIAQFEKEDFASLVARAVVAARHRAEELGS